MENNLSEYRKERGFSQQALADELGVSRQTVISLEKGRYDPSLPLAFKLAALFQCRIEDLFLPKAPSSRQRADALPE
ncbi:helix-turn-helix transcriptional regulator [Glutamicibacter mishrai]|uniref:helix-turn-helix transcriptional regulator n=1 Tax=Glutamicibacter mishrai TaxID=1775880 RepID=UPI0020CEC6AF|nr:helix-turn-helix transcriptional regulator [Glutamicibacter mishrai]UTT39872.1 helix-turn-helix transcriptional regulator [Glutamicibacter mishrai]